MFVQQVQGMLFLRTGMSEESNNGTEGDTGRGKHCLLKSLFAMVGC